MIPLSNSDTSALCRYLKDAKSFYLLHSATTSAVNRARLMSIMHDKLAIKLIRHQCEIIIEQLKDLQS